MTEVNEKSKKHHFFRALFAGLIGAVALLLATFSIIFWWVTDTTLNTDNYVNKVADISGSKPVQYFISDRLGDLLVNESDIPVQDVAAAILPEDQQVGKSDEELKLVLRDYITDDLSVILASDEFQAEWLRANRHIHSQLIESLNKQSEEPVVVDLGQTINTAVSMLGKTKFSDLQDKIEIPEENTKFQIPAGNLDQPRKIYRIVKLGRIGLVILSILLIGLAVLISTHHLRTLRRILIFFAIQCAVLAVVFSAGWILRGVTLPNGSETDKQLMISLINVLFGDLRNTLLILSISAVMGAIGSKLIDKSAISRNPK